MGSYPTPSYSRTRVIKAGKLLADTLPHTASIPDHVFDAFRVAYDWRNAHIFPMQSVRRQLNLTAKRANIEIIGAGRVKRIVSIRKKLARRNTSLTNIQDIAGCRAITDTIHSLTHLISECRQKFSNHQLYDESDYIQSPKNSGYRSHHIMLKYNLNGEKFAYDGMRVEIQLRTRLQHAWATAVEAVGLYRNEDLKGGNGNQYWLNFFQLMSGEIAERESCPMPDGVPPRNIRHERIKALNFQTNALNTLENLSVAFREINSTSLRTSQYILMEYNRENSTVRIRSYPGALEIASKYSSSSETSVLIQVDKVVNLQDAYPNYFGDVGAFRKILFQIIKGYDIDELRIPRR